MSLTGTTSRGKLSPINQITTRVLPTRSQSDRPAILRSISANLVATKLSNHILFSPSLVTIRRAIPVSCQWLADSPEPTASTTWTSRFKHFLLVDDNRINLRVLAAFAKHLDVLYSIAADGAELVRLYKNATLEESNPFDYIYGHQHASTGRLPSDDCDSAMRSSSDVFLRSSNLRGRLSLP